MKKIILTMMGTSLLLTACNGGGSSANLASPNSKTAKAAVGSIKAAYVDTTAPGGYDAITTKAFASASMVIFGFANINSSTMTPALIAQLQKAMNAETAGTVNLLSIGGEYATPDTINAASMQTIANNVIAQINTFNKLNPTQQIAGVDLDLEMGIDANTISGLANLFKQAGLKVGAAPQVYLSSGTNIDSTNPVANMVLTSGGGGIEKHPEWDRSKENVYQTALNSGNVDYLFVQTYNTSGFTIDGVGEQNIHFFKNTAKGLNNTVKSQCAGTKLCIPATTNIVVGTVANRYAGWFTPFDNNQSAADQLATLKMLKADIDSMTGDANYSNFAGTMVWSLNMDSAAKLYDTANTAYGTDYFTSLIFSGIEPTPSTGAYFSLQLANNGISKYGSVSLQTSTVTYNFGNASDNPLGLKGTQIIWGTQASAAQNPNILDSWSLDNIFNTQGLQSLTAKVVIRSYASATANIQQTVGTETVCQPTYSFQVGRAYNIQFNADNGICSITSF